ncbi:MAG: amino acid ABC transporter permease [Legionellales bacterium]|nr:amino acid ABC transporter permease [Legionellales bacterium]
MNEFLADVVFIGSGIYITLELLFGGLIIGLILGVLAAVLRYNEIGVFFINRVISILRGSPLILQLSFIYFSTPAVLGIKLSIISAGIISFGLNSFAYIAEILRAGINSVPKGQFEAAKTLRIPNYYMWKDIILPQVFRNVFPAMVNEIISLLKETALISTIGGMDIMRTSQTLAAQQFSYFIPLCIAGGYYYGLVLFVEYLGRKIERRAFHVEN